MKLFSKNSNPCDHKSQYTNVTDRRADGWTDRQLIMAIPRYATLHAVKTGNEKHAYFHKSWGKIKGRKIKLLEQ